MEGISSEIVHNGLSLLVQTQVIGGAQLQIETLVYHRGQLLHSRKTPLDWTSSPEAKLSRILAEAHQAILKDLAAGRLDAYLPGSRP